MELVEAHSLIIIGSAMVCSAMHSVVPRYKQEGMSTGIVHAISMPSERRCSRYGYGQYLATSAISILNGDEMTIYMPGRQSFGESWRGC